MTILAVTGHRPEKLGGYGGDAISRVDLFAIETLRSRSPPAEVITGMALGWDQSIALACYALSIPFAAYVPFDGQESRWPLASQREYRRLLAIASRVVVVSPGGYAPWKMHARNAAMVRDCHTLVALWNGDETGGTAACWAVAVRAGRERVNVWDGWQASR